MLSFKELDKSKLFGLLRDRDGKVKEEIYLNEQRKEKLVQDKNFKEKINKYVDSFEEDEEGIIRSFKLKDQYSIEYCPPKFNSENQRIVSYICGKSGSGKTYYTAGLLEKYFRMYKKNKIYYVSANKISNDSSFEKLLKIEGFKKNFIQIDLNSIQSTIEFSDYNNCLFVFDDIIDVEISLNPLETAKEYLADLATTKKNFDIKTYKLTQSDQQKIQRITKMKAEIIKSYILSSIESLLNLGRKNGISVIVTCHAMFNGAKSNRAINESQDVILFPFSNVSNLKLAEFLETKLSFDKSQSKEIIKTKFIMYDYLHISVSGSKFFFTSREFSFL